MGEIYSGSIEPGKLKSFMGQLSDDQKKEVLKLLNINEDFGEIIECTDEKLICDRDAVANDLKLNHITIDSAEMMGLKGKIIHIKLPPIGKFKGYDFKFFYSDCGIFPNEFDSKFRENSYSISEISEFLTALEDYFKVYSGREDTYIVDLKKYLNCAPENSGCGVGSMFRNLLSGSGIDEFKYFYLKDRPEEVEPAKCNKRRGYKDGYYACDFLFVDYTRLNEGLNVLLKC